VVKPIMFKRCSRCRATKSADSFGVDRHTADRLTAYCKHCRSELNREYYLANRDEILARDRQRYHQGKTKQQGESA